MVIVELSRSEWYAILAETGYEVVISGDQARELLRRLGMDDEAGGA